MLEIKENVIVVKKAIGIGNVFQQFTDYTGQGDGAGFIGFLIYGVDVCDLPSTELFNEYLDILVLEAMISQTILQNQEQKMTILKSLAV